ncbi:MAG: hypothetical protein E7623_07465, partial [Ruminococcaceae bacterium]|nr:hypothetical protein [Oscillospiraceae bacterium]
GESADQYAEFTDAATICGGDTFINISCDSDYTLYVNGKYAASNQYGDFEHYKIYDTVDISRYLVCGENKIDILVHYFGVATQRYRPAKAGLIYEIISEGKTVASSGEHTLSRKSLAYESGNCVMVSTQLGFNFTYDASKEADGGFAPSVISEKECSFFKRPIKKARVCDTVYAELLKNDKNKHFIFDLGREIVGLPVLDLFSGTEQTVTVAFGEHINDGCVRQKMGGRNFSYVYKTKVGKNEFSNYMLRLGCRYFEVFADEPLSIEGIGLRPQVYEAEDRQCFIEGELDRRIYDVCLNTLHLCMMEHYVDCPWREQALYTFDSRNQMLCGYYAFEGGNKEYARSNLKLIGEDRRDDGLLSICYPCGSDLAIPSFSLYYLFSMREYIDHTKDTGLAFEMYPKMCGIFEEFLSNSSEGLIRRFSGDLMWNFYDWSEYSSGALYSTESPVADLAINCLFVMALDHFHCICKAIGTEFPYDGLAEKMRGNIRKEFLCDNGLYTMLKGKKQFTVLGNSFAVLSGVAYGADAENICEKILCGELTECSLSMKIFKYEALLKTGEIKYSETILSEIRRDYKYMLDSGADTVWETIVGADDFDNAGSLCHGWSAVPIYIYHKLGIAK